MARAYGTVSGPVERRARALDQPALPQAVAFDPNVGVLRPTDAGSTTGVDAGAATMAAPDVRQTSASLANRLTIARAAEGTVELGELGRVSVKATANGSGVDVRVAAQSHETLGLIREHRTAMEADLKGAAIGVSKLEVVRGADRSEAKVAVEAPAPAPRIEASHSGSGSGDTTSSHRDTPREHAGRDPNASAPGAWHGGGNAFHGERRTFQDNYRHDSSDSSDLGPINHSTGDDGEAASTSIGRVRIVL